nr:glycosyltransferase family 4 protein [Kineococcus aurantiacus]
MSVATDAQVLGGAEVFLQHLLRGLPDDVEVSVLGSSPSVLRAVCAGTPVRWAVPAPGPAGTLRVLHAQRPDVLHVNLTAFTSCRPVLLAAAAARVPSVLVDHLPTPGLTWRGRSLQRLVTTWAAARVSVSASSARAVEQLGGLRPGSVLAIPNGVPVPRVRPAPQVRRPALGVLARLEPQKGVDVLLEALTALPGVELHVAGEGSGCADLQQQAAALGLTDRVRFRGRVPDAADLLSDVDVLVVPSRFEALPLVVLEAMHGGVPVVASRVGGIPEAVLDGQTGLLVPAGDAVALAGACRTLLDDPGLRARLATRARVRADELFSVTAMARRYDGLYRRVVGLSA